MTMYGLTPIPLDMANQKFQLRVCIQYLDTAKALYKQAQLAADKLTDPELKRLAEQYLSGEITP